MDRLKGKRISGPVMPEKARMLVFYENMRKKKDDKSVPMCSRIGCSSRINSTKRGVIDYTAKSTVSSSFRSPSNGKETIGSSSRSMRQLSSLLDTDSSESNSAHDESPTTESRGKTKESSASVHSENTVSADVVTEAGSSSRSIHKRPDLVTGEARMLNSWQNSRAGVNSYGLRSKFGSDIPPSNPNSTRKSNIFRMQNSDGESSSSNKEIKMDRAVIEVRNQRYPQGNCVTMSESTRNKNLQMFRDATVLSSRARRSSGSYDRTGRSGEVAALRVPMPTTFVDLNPIRSAEFFNSPSNSYSRPISSNDRLRSLMEPVSLSEASLSRSLMNRDSFRHYNMNRVAEVLLALERIEQDQDQHRDMRLDIDNMSYEELLALGEKIGSVSTALSEESLLKSLKSDIYRPTEKPGGLSLNKEDDDVKCSICQEEYVDEDEVGTLPCRHMYHVSCVQQWLWLKNWCPICKTSAESKPKPFSL